MLPSNRLHSQPASHQFKPVPVKMLRAAVTTVHSLWAKLSPSPAQTVVQLEFLGIPCCFDALARGTLRIPLNAVSPYSSVSLV